jgi:cytochrome c biogenesis protein
MSWQWISKLASLKFTLFVIALVGIGVTISYRSEGTTTWALVLPLFLFSLNIIVAVITNPVFRRKKSLLMFHLALIALILLIALGRLTFLKGKVEIADGEAFSSRMAAIDKGPWHWGRLDQLSFINEGFTIEYVPDVYGVERGATINRLRWLDESGKEQHGVIGDLVPLNLYGYKFYTSPNKGFAPTFIWRPNTGAPPVMGAVHLPSYPKYEYKQALSWTPPGGKTPVWIMLQFDEVILDPKKPSEFRLPSTHQMIVRIGEERHEIKPGESIKLPEGVLEYAGLRSWMGYNIFYDFTLPWLLIAGVFAVCSMAVYFWGKFSDRPWDK